MKRNQSSVVSSLPFMTQFSRAFIKSDTNRLKQARIVSSLFVLEDERWLWTKVVLPVKKTVGDPSPSNSPAVLESKRSQRPTASTPVPASCKRR